MHLGPTAHATTAYPLLRKIVYLWSWNPSNHNAPHCASGPNKKMVLENEISLVMSLHLGQLHTIYLYFSAWALHYHPSMKEGSLFCFVLLCFCFVVTRCTELVCFRSCSWCLWKALDDKGCMGLVPWRLDLQCKSSWVLNDFFTEFGFRMWEILILKWFVLLKNSYKFPKTRFWKGKSVENVVTLGPMAQATLVTIELTSDSNINIFSFSSWIL
jgi:hypothetical protein